MPDNERTETRERVISVSRLEEERSAWTQQFAGGMLQFDNAYFDALRAGSTPAEANRCGAEALLDAFVDRLKEVADD